MAQVSNHTYTQGHSQNTIATHLMRTPETDGAFVLPYIKHTDIILDVGCGPGSITTGFAKYASEGRIVGVDISTDVLQKARQLAAEAKAPTEGPGSVNFELGNVLERLPFDDATFDVVFCSQVFGHIPPPELPLKAMAEIRRVLKAGGILATRDGVTQHFYPQRFKLDRLWGENQKRVLTGTGAADADATGALMPAFFRHAGFDADNGKIIVSCGTRVTTGFEARRWLVKRATGQLQKGDPFYQSWINAGITEEEIQELLHQANAWAETEDAWFVGVMCEVVAWK